MIESGSARSSAPSFEARLPCPVCIGVQMEKAQIGTATSAVVLDHCPRCGGVWFEKGEAQQLTRHAPSLLWQHIPPRASMLKPLCHGCRAPLDRDAKRCGVCGKDNVLECPMCAKAMERREHAGLTLDVCSHCKGVWFDHVELKRLWSITVNDMQRKRGAGAMNAAAVGGDILLESLFWAPGLMLHAGSATVSGIGHAAGALGSVSIDGAASAAMGAAEAAGGAAEGVFSAIMEIIAGIFD